MAYSNANDYKNKSVYLNISTSFGTLNGIDTSGTWSPDDKNAK
ncbi:hypothetical protein [Clostridium algidicarnis]|nr:hypothetical protein [Clostridium algidicarnis]